MEKVTVNAMGKPCPMPVVEAKKALAGMAGAGALEVLVDNEIAVQNLLRLASGSGLQARSEKRGPGQFAVLMAHDGVPVAAAADEPVAAAADEPVACMPDQRGDAVVAIGSACMGVGSEALGRLLMKGFIYALSQQERLPKTILFYNGGATIPVEGSASLEDLRSMEAQGVEILTCGTCLDYYGLKDRLAVGGVTNMYSIVELLANAAKVIRP